MSDCYEETNLVSLILTDFLFWFTSATAQPLYVFYFLFCSYHLFRLLLFLSPLFLSTGFLFVVHYSIRGGYSTSHCQFFRPTIRRIAKMLKIKLDPDVWFHHFESLELLISEIKANHCGEHAERNSRVGDENVAGKFRGDSEESCQGSEEQSMGVQSEDGPDEISWNIQEKKLIGTQFTFETGVDSTESEFRDHSYELSEVNGELKEEICERNEQKEERSLKFVNDPNENFRIFQELTFAVNFRKSSVIFSNRTREETQAEDVFHRSRKESKQFELRGEVWRRIQEIENRLLEVDRKKEQRTNSLKLQEDSGVEIYERDEQKPDKFSRKIQKTEDPKEFSQRRERTPSFHDCPEDFSPTNQEKIEKENQEKSNCSSSDLNIKIPDREWNKTLAGKIYEERQTVTGSDSMDLLWEAYEEDPRAVQKEINHKNAQNMDFSDQEEEIGATFCCMKLNFGLRRSEIVGISKLLKGFGWFQHRRKLKGKKWQTIKN